MNELQVLRRLRPEIEPLAEATFERIWGDITGAPGDGPESPRRTEPVLGPLFALETSRKRSARSRVLTVAAAVLVMVGVGAIVGVRAVVNEANQPDATEQLRADTASGAGETTSSRAPGADPIAGVDVDAGTTHATNHESPTTVVAGAYPVASTVVLSGPFPLPSNEQINPDLDERCTKMYGVIRDLPLGNYVPQIAKGVSAAYGADDNIGCEIYFGGPLEGRAVSIDSELAIAWLDEALPNRGPTGDSDETRVAMSSGNVGFVDPTGNDGAGYDDVRVVSVPQDDGSVVFVIGFAGTPLDVTITFADQFDQALTK